MTSDFNYNQNGFYVENGVLVQFDESEYSGQLMHLHVPKGVTEIGRYAFVQNKGADDAGVIDLENVHLPASCTVIRTGAFYSCINLIQVYTSSNIELLEEGAFSDCRNLSQYITWPEGQDYVPDHLYDRSGLSDVYFPSNIKTIGDSAFYDNVNLTACFGSSIESIGNSAFYHCCSLSEPLEFPESLRDIGYGAFEDAFSVPAIILHSCPDIADNAFEGMSAVKYIQVPKEMEVPDGLWGLSNDVEVRRV